MGRRLERHLDQDLIDRMASGWTPKSRANLPKKSKPARDLDSYRGARRNATLHGETKSTWRGGRTGTEPYYNHSKSYPYSNTRQNTRNKWRHDRAMAQFA